VFGDLTIRDVTRTVVLEGAAHGSGTNPWGQQVAGFRGTTTINRADFGLVWNAALGGGGFLVGDEVEVEIELEATREA
jgi:polyisoprenoid-binding protein YceI